MKPDMTGADALAAWGEAMLRGSGDFECGASWELEYGWRCYMRTGTSVLFMKPRSMRKLGVAYRDSLEAPEDVRALGAAMIDCSNDVKERNKRHEIPDMAVAHIPHQGGVQ